MYSEALALVGELLRDLKRMDDKLALIEVHLLECRVFFVLRNTPKAKAALTAARSSANAVYCPPALQAALDMQSALMHADEGDFKTAYSYFVEALDSFASLQDPRGATALKYMLLCKIMTGHSDEIDQIVLGKLARTYCLGEEVAAMKSIGEAYKQKSLRDFEAALAKYPEHLGTDMMVHAHFQTLYDQLLQQNLLSIVEPYSKVQLAFVAHAIGLPVDVVESKYAAAGRAHPPHRLSLMILDSQLGAIIDQNEHCLLLSASSAHDVPSFPPPALTLQSAFSLSLATLGHLHAALDALLQKSSGLAQTY